MEPLSIILLVTLAGIFLYGIYAVIKVSIVEEQNARIACNQMFENLGIEPIYSEEEIEYPFRNINRMEEET